ncbi:MAG: hypothetical protein KAI99_03135 [Cyclobacteriaceae bacterium]|nr:hypothetical protein [Cyclobacteriaceae bacterium]
MRISALLFSAILIVFSSCHQSKKITIATSLKGSAAEKVGVEIANYLNNNGWEVETISGGDYYGSKNIKVLQEDLADFAFVSNDVAFSKDSKGIQTVMPLYPDLSYIFYRNNLEPKSLEDLIENNSLLISTDDENFFLRLFDYYGLNTNNLKINKLNLGHSVEEVLQEINNGKNNVICIFAAIQNPHIKDLIDNGWEIFSLGDINFSNRGSSVEGFCMNYPRTEPFIIPKNFFGQKPTYPIYTVSLNELIVTKSDMDETLIYDFVKDIYAGKHYLSQNEILCTHIKEDFDRDALNFPLHQGTIDFLERDQPSFFERYAEAFGVIFSILIVLYGGLTSLRKIRKERIDKYFKRVMECQNTHELEELSNEAVRQLQSEKLTADESFTIFLNLVEKRRHEIENNPIK